ncbi:MAG: TspO/MBR family protein [Bacillota bacterium]
MKYKQILPFLICIGLAFLAGAIGSFYTFPNIASWYAGLVHPSWTPPNWVFGPVWTTLYILMGMAAALIWRSGRKGTLLPLALYFVQLTVNASWSIVFFGMHNLIGGLVIIKVLWLMIAALMALSWRYSRTATYLLIPYLLWVTYAATLNLGIFLLN